MRTITGVPAASDQANAWAISGAHWATEVGSTTGTSATRASQRESCSFWEPQAPGSSPKSTTSPRWQPV